MTEKVLSELAADHSAKHKLNRAQRERRERILRKNRDRRKKCAKCGGVKSLIDDFARHDTSSDGFASYCNDCRNGLNTRRRKVNISFRLKHHIATRVAKQFENLTLPERYVKDLEKYLGYNMGALRKALHANLKLREGISLKEAIARDYHLDHIKPLSLFKPSSINSPVFKDCWAINNLKMIPAADNLAKGAKYSGDVSG